MNLFRKACLLITFFCLSVFSIIIWQQIFNLPANLIPMHALVSFVIHLLFFLFLAFIARFKLGLALVPWLLAHYFLLWLAFYVLIFLSMSFWGDIITVKITKSYLLHLPEVIHFLPWSLYLTGTVVLGIYILTLVNTFAFRKSVVLGFNDWGNNVLLLIKSKHVLLGLMLLCSAAVYRPLKRAMHFEGEPVLVFIEGKMWSVEDNPFFDRNRVAVSREDKECRRRYTLNNRKNPKKNVIVIMVDALRADHLSVYGYKRHTTPFLKKLVADEKAVLVKRTIATSPSTAGGISSLFLSRSWKNCTLNGFTLQGLLKDAGYQTYAILTGDHRNWYSLPKLYQRDCDFYFDGAGSTQFYFNDDRVLFEGLSKVPDYSGTPALFYFHVLASHHIGVVQPAFRKYTPAKGMFADNKEWAMNDYDNRVMQVDDIIRQLFDSLGAKGYLDNSVVVITADHGQELGEHNDWGHGTNLYQPQIEIPLIIYDDSLSRYKNTKFARQIDIAPTIAERIGLVKPKVWEGTSLLKDSISQFSYHQTIGANHHWYSLISYQDSAVYKIIYDKNLLLNEVYNITTDPDELTNLKGLFPENFKVNQCFDTN